MYPRVLNASHAMHKYLKSQSNLAKFEPSLKILVHIKIEKFMRKEANKTDFTTLSNLYKSNTEQKSQELDMAGVSISFQIKM